MGIKDWGKKLASKIVIKKVKDKASEVKNKETPEKTPKELEQELSELKKTAPAEADRLVAEAKASVELAKINVTEAQAKANNASGWIKSKAAKVSLGSYKRKLKRTEKAAGEAEVASKKVADLADDPKATIEGIKEALKETHLAAERADKSSRDGLIKKGADATKKGAKLLKSEALKKVKKEANVDDPENENAHVADVTTNVAPAILDTAPDVLQEANGVLNAAGQDMVASLGALDENAMAALRGVDDPDQQQLFKDNISNFEEKNLQAANVDVGSTVSLENKAVPGMNA